MAREYIDRITDSSNNDTVYQIVDETTGSTIAARALLVPVNVIVEGDRFGARAANRILELDDDATPMLAIDGGTVKKPTGWQTQYRQDGGAIPTKLLPAQLFVADSGNVYVGDVNETPVLLGNMDTIQAVQKALDTHTARTDNPHIVTRGQLGAAADADLTAHKSAANPHSDSASSTALSSHTGSINNPHKVTAAQTGALPKSGGDVSGSITASGGLSGSGLQVINNGHKTTIYHSGTRVVFGINEGGTTGSTDILFRNSTSGSAGLALCYGNFTTSSTRKNKENIKPLGSNIANALLSAEVMQYTYRKDSEIDGSGKIHYGLIAEDLQQIDPTFVVTDTEGNASGISYFEMVPVLLKIVQEQNVRITALESAKSNKK